MSPPRRWANEAELAVRAAVRRSLTDIPRGARVLVACSGGPDSTALAAAAAFECPRAGLRAGAVVVDHGLQPGSAAVAARTAGWLGQQGLDPVEVARVEVGHDGGPEASARTARYASLAAAAQRWDAAAVLLGHTLDDQAETVLLGLARGSGARSLAGMAPRRDPYRRPLLALPRATVASAVPPGAPVWTDPHNADPAYARVRLRTTGLPALEQAVGPGVAQALARSADLLRADADALDGWAARARSELGGTAELGDAAGLDLAGLAALPAAVRARVLRLAAADAGAERLTAGHVAALEAMVTDWHGQGAPALPAGVVAARRCGRLWLRRGAAPGQRQE